MSTPSQLGKYRIVRELGRGSMGVVYEGFDPSIQRRVAIKVVREADLDAAERVELHSRLEREAQAAGRLNHPNIVAVYDFGEDATSPSTRVAFIAMELVEGTELKALFDKGHRFSMQDIARVMHDILVALQHAHERRVVHRDVKPGNVILLPDGSVKLTDFGVARLENSEMTRAGTILGSPQYMSPEQLLGMPVDGRSDLFACGVILYQFLTGAKPFTGSVATVMQQVLNVDPVPPTQLNPALPRVWDGVLRKAMAKKPEARYQRAEEMAAAVALAAAGEDADATVVQGAPAEARAAAVERDSRARQAWRAALATLLLGSAAAGMWVLLRPATAVKTDGAPATSAAVSDPAGSAATNARPTATPIDQPLTQSLHSPTAPERAPVQPVEQVALPPRLISAASARPPTAPPSAAARQADLALKASVAKPPPAHAAESAQRKPAQAASPVPTPSVSAPAPPPPEVAEAATDWRRLAAQLASSSQVVTLGAALTQLLDLTEDTDRRRMDELDGRIRLLPANVHVAMGTRDGYLVFAWSNNAANLPDTDTILRRCESVPAQYCRLVVTRNELSRGKLVEVATQLGGRRQAEVRSRALAAIERMSVSLRKLETDLAAITPAPAPTPAPLAAVKPAPTPTPAPPAHPSPAAAEWDAARAALRSHSGGTSLSAAMAVLLQASSADELDVLTRFEAAMKGLQWKSALAMGVLRNGHVTFGYSSRESKAEWATESAVKACSRNTAEPCTVIMQNGSLVDGGLQALAVKLGQAPQANVRRSLIQTIRNHAVLR